MNKELIEFLTKIREAADNLPNTLEADQMIPPMLFLQTQEGDEEQEDGEMELSSVFSGDPRGKVVFMEHVLPRLINSQHVKRLVMAAEIGIQKETVGKLKDAIEEAKPETFDQFNELMDKFPYERALVLIAADGDGGVCLFNKINQVEGFAPRLTDWDMLDISEEYQDDNDWKMSRSAFDLLVRDRIRSFVNSINGKMPDDGAEITEIDARNKNNFPGFSNN